MFNCYAPVIIPTLCRFEHLKDCIESLQKNPLAKNTILYIALDYPSKPSHFVGYDKIVKYIEDGIKGFEDVIVLKREKNFGAVKNITDAIEEVSKIHDRYIISEDDNLFSPNFLEFINIGLTEYEKDADVIAINGYSCPCTYFDDGLNVVKSKHIFSAWGVGLWRDKEQNLEKNLTLQKYRKYLKNKEKSTQFYKEFPRNFCYYIQTTLSKNFLKTDVVKQSYMYFEDKYVIFPKLSLVRNLGWDGSGVHKVESFKDSDLGFANQKIDTNSNFDNYLLKDVIEHKENLALLNKCLPCSEEFDRKTMKILKFIRIFGVSLFYLLVDIIYTITYPFRKLKKRR